MIALSIGVKPLATPYTSSGAYSGASGDLSLVTKTAQPIKFFTNDTERGQVTPAGYAKHDPNATYNPAGTSHEFIGNVAGSEVVEIWHKGANPNGVYMNFNTSPNNGSNWFATLTDSLATRMQFNSNGGLASYSANNTNLSDAAVKGAVEPYDDKQLDALQASFLQVNWGRFKYLDQSHTDWNHGYTAQGVEEAFALTAPELVDDTDLGPKGEGGKRKAVYDSDLTHIALALLARALKRIAALEAKAALS
jgi:hypothetical protein